jgi:hypothetical protein
MKSSSTSVMFWPCAAVTDLKVLCSSIGTFKFMRVSPDLRIIPEPVTAQESSKVTRLGIGFFLEPIHPAWQIPSRREEKAIRDRELETGSERRGRCTQMGWKISLTRGCGRLPDQSDQWGKATAYSMSWENVKLLYRCPTPLPKKPM